MFNSPTKKLPPKISRSSSCKDISLLLAKETRFSICSSLSFKSADDLPAAVAECFQENSFLGRIQNKLLLFLGRGSRYRVQPRKAFSFFNVTQKENPTKKEAMSPKKDYAASPSQLTQKQFRKDHFSPILRIKPKASSTPVQSKKSSKFDSTQKNNEEESSSTSTVTLTLKENPQTESCAYTEEESIMRQYMSLQRLAIARRHCNQLRRIRDSLSTKVKTKPCPLAPSPEQEKLRNFLMDVGFVQYYVHLNRHGYDLPTASHMDVLDLAAVGVNEPLHRMALKYELDQIRHSVTPAKEVPDDISEWLEILGLSEYTEHFQVNGFYCPLAAVGLTKRDLHLMGIYMNGHRKKLVMALTSLKAALFTNDFSKH